LWMTALVTVPLVVLDIMFLGATLLNLLEGAWVPVVIGAAIVLVMVTWQRGSALLALKTRRIELPLDVLIGQLEKRPPHIVAGTAIFLTSQPELAPTALLHNLKHNKMLHESNLIVSVITEDIPQVREQHRVKVTRLSPRFSVVQLRFGFMETPNVPRAMVLARDYGVTFEMMSTSFFLSRRSLKQDARSGMPLWQDKLFIAASRSADDASNYFRIPTGRVVEIGTQIAI
jgi:KUP system potassium uptake protein